MLLCCSCVVPSLLLYCPCVALIVLKCFQSCHCVVPMLFLCDSCVIIVFAFAAISCVVIVLSLCSVYMLFRCSSYVVHVLFLFCPCVVPMVYYVVFDV